MIVEAGGMVQDARNAQADGELCTFPVTTIDNIRRELGLERLDLIKMDIEGAEPNALSGASLCGNAGFAALVDSTWGAAVLES
jgi:FkbM family methyltransferase